MCGPPYLWIPLPETTLLRCKSYELRYVPRAYIYAFAQSRPVDDIVEYLLLGDEI